jgi:hypothetical protein
VLNYADTSTSESFHYWLATSDSAFEMDFNVGGEKVAWLESEPFPAQLSGLGPVHNDQMVYNDTIKSREGSRLRSLRRTSAKPGSVGATPAFKMMGVELANETAVPGSYWGANPRRWNVKDSNYINIQETLVNSPDSLYKRWINLSPDLIQKKGIKEFIIVAVFKGRFFGDTRTVVSCKNELGEFTTRTFFDLYPPAVNINYQDNPYYLSDDSTVAASFAYGLCSSVEAGAAVFDGGFAEVTKVNLVIARKPDSLTWVAKETYKKFLADQNLIYTYPHIILPFEINDQQYFLWNVRWENIDPTAWPTGEYIMAVITADEFGNEGMGISNILRDAFPNPWRIKVLTGR